MLYLTGYPDQQRDADLRSVPPGSEQFLSSAAAARPAVCGLIVVLAALLLMVAPVSVRAQQGVDKEKYATWGLNVFGHIQNELKKPSSALYAETVSQTGTQSGGSGGFSYVWPAGIQFRVLNALAFRDPATYAPLQRAFSDELRTRYWRNTTVGGYRSGTPSGSGVFYDDNAHIAIAEVDAYEATHDATYLQRAKDTYNFVLRGEDNVGGGGIYFVENDFSFKDSVPTLQAARAAAMLYRATGDTHYFDDAQRLYNWAKNTTQTSDGLFWEKLYVDGPKAGTLGDNRLVNATGMGISANIEFYKATHDAAYLNEAKRIAHQAVLTFTDTVTTKRINDEGYWAFELIDALADLYEMNPSIQWSNTTYLGLDYLHAHKEDANGHYGLMWGRDPDPTTPLTSWNLIDQAPVARAYLSLSQIRRGLPGDYNNDGVVDLADYTVWRDHFGESVLFLPNAFGAGPIGVAQYDLWKQQFGTASSGGGGLSMTVPEPISMAFASVALVIALAWRVRRKISVRSQRGAK